jgi:hypothetical protein
MRAVVILLIATLLAAVFLSAQDPAVSPQHRPPYSVLRVGSEFQATGLIKAVHRMNQANHTGTGQIVECDARRYPALETSRDSVYQIEVLKDCSFSGFAVVRNAFGGVAEFHFRSYSARLVRGNKQRAELLLNDFTSGGGSPTRPQRAERWRRLWSPDFPPRGVRGKARHRDGRGDHAASALRSGEGYGALHIPTTVLQNR